MKYLFILILVTCLSGILFYQMLNSSTISPLPPLNLETDALTIPLGLDPVPWPKDNPYHAKKAELGRLLYFDKRLSADQTISCATCHSVPRAFTDHKSVAQGILGRKGTRHTPTIINACYQKLLFWDGRAANLEEQSKGPLANDNEMALSNDVHQAHIQCQNRVKSIKGYKALFKEVFGNDDCSIDDIAKAIATFERTILSGNSPLDRYRAGDKSALTPQQVHGYTIFLKSKCLNCHGGPTFSNDNFFNIGIGMNADNPDLGRYNITKKEKDWGAFKVPTLRDAEHLYPYMHDGSLKTLEEVIDYYDKGGTPNPNQSLLIKPLHLSDKDKQDLLSFLKALNGTGWQHFKEPTKFPE